MEHKQTGGIPAPALLVFLLMLLLPVHLLAAPTVTLITTYPSGAQAPAIFGNTVVWQDYRNGNWDIYLYNMISGNETRITTDASDQVDPEIYGDLLVWDDSRLDTSGGFTSAIFLYNLTTGQEIQLSDGDLSYQSHPAIYGNRIVWSDDRTGPAIFINGTSPGTETPLSPATGSQDNPAIYGDLVVWDDTRNSPPDNTRDIYSYSIATNTETQITNDLQDQAFPGLFGSKIVWSDTRNGNIEIFMNGSAPGLEYSITPNQPALNHHHTSIYGPKVVWEQTNISGGTDIFMNDTSTGLQTPIAVNPGSLKDYPRIFTDPNPQYGDRVVWQDDRSGHNQIFLYSSNGPGTCPVSAFTSNFTGGSAPAAVHFMDTSAPGGSTHWLWDFGDGSNSTDGNPDHIYTTNDPFTVTLTVGNPWCRNATSVPDFIVLGRPVANFDASPSYGVSPVTVQFTDTSAGIPDTWNWSFGDTSWFNTTDPGLKNPIHVYSTPGIYTVNLTASNVFGANTKTGYITVFAGANEFANTTINGLSIDNCAGPQTITVDSSVITASLTPNTSVLELQPPADRGFEKIIVYALDGTGFTTNGPFITGHVTGVHLQTLNIAPTAFSPLTGPISVNYSADLSAYPCNAVLNTQIWEGTTPDDRDKFERIALGSSFAHWEGTLYTTKIIKTHFPDGGTARFHMSANESWVTEKGGHNQIYIEHIFENGTMGEVLPTPYLLQDPMQNLDYFEADSPHGLSTFGLSALSGSGNPLQLITLTVTSHVPQPAPNNNPASDSDTGGNSAARAAGTPVITLTPNVTASPTPVPTVDPGTSAKVYTNANGVVTQAFLLTSTDGRVMVSLKEGTVAKDASGNPLSQITIKALPSGSLPSLASGSTFTFAGMAYDIGPDGATFSPPVSLSFTLPQAQWGQDYSVKTFDTTSGAWQDLPTSFDTSTGTITAQASHLCTFALFAQPHADAVPPPTPRSTPAPAPAAPQVKAPPPTTAVSIVMSMLTWTAGLMINNIIPLAAFVFLGIAGYLVMLGKFPGSGQ